MNEVYLDKVLSQYCCYEQERCGWYTIRPERLEGVVK